MKPAHIFYRLSVLTLICVMAALAQQSGRENRRSAIMNGNQVRSVFGNWGVIGQPTDTRPRGSWKDDNNGYLGDVSPFIGAEVKWKDTSFRSVVTSPVARPSQLPDTDPATGVDWTFEPVSGYFADAPNQSVAISNNSDSWPTQWPDKLSDGVDPGWRGAWNGYFGKRVSADLESYFVMNDNNDLRFNSALNNSRQIAFHPDSLHPSTNGLALEVRVRAMQWAQFLAQDNIFWLYEIANRGTTNYDRAVFGMLVGTYVGVTGSDGGPAEYDDDWSFYDVRENITYTGDFDRNTNRNPRWNQNFPVGMVGYAFLESPGNPFDGIDNDGDADSSTTGRAAPQFTSTSFDSTLIAAGSRIVLIKDDFSRVVVTVPSVDAFKIKTRGMRDSVVIYPGKTKVIEGNLAFDILGNQVVNRNAYDGIDNNFNGLIDENQTLHYRQFKRNRNPPYQVLIDNLRPVRHIDYLANLGTSVYSLLDEKRNDRIDNDQDWDIAFDDLGRDGIGPTAVNYPGPDFGEGDGQPTSGYDNSGNDTGLPGEQHIDKTDVNESDQVGLSSFYYFAPANQVRLGDDEDLWKNLAPGYFDVPTSIVYSATAGTSRPERGEDGDFIYGSGYFPLLAGTTERFSLALVYGGGKGGTLQDDIDDMLKNKRTVQKIYDANYQFPTPPDKPTLVAVPGDRQVTLYWNRVAEASVDPVLRVKDFEGYKLYKSTDANWSDLAAITDATGSVRGVKPLKQWDVKDGIKGYFRPGAELYQAAAGFSFDLGSETGIEHSYVDTDVQNGRRYFYAIVAYDRGDELAGIFPGENTKPVQILSTGEVEVDINVAVVTPNARTAGYVTPKSSVELQRISGPATGSAAFQILDDTRLTGHRYRVTFLDTQTDGVDNNRNGKIDAADSTEWNRITTAYSVLDLNDVSEKFISQDTVSVSLTRANLVASTVVVKNAAGGVVSPSSYVLNAARGSIRGKTAGTLPAGTYTISFQYYPVYNSPNIQGTIYQVENGEADIFDGLDLAFGNFWSVRDTSDATSGWKGKSAYVYSFSPVDLPLLEPPLLGYRKPADYELRFASAIVDTSAIGPYPFDVPVPVNFRIYNTTDSTYVKFLLQENPIPRGENKISPLDEIVLMEKNPRGVIAPTYDLFFSTKQGDPGDTVYNLTTGDKLIIKTTKPFRNGDVFEFQTELPKLDEQKATATLGDVRVVPNPYVTASAFEAPLNPGITSGRGERKMDFINLPADASIKIFTSRGDHVITLHHDAGNMQSGTVSWNLKSKENLDIAFGVYFYVIESPVGNKTGKIAIIK
jgi:hypothetical protein